MSAKANILRLLKENVGKSVPREAIVSAAGSTEWARRVRDLRAEGWHIEPTKEGYRLVSLVKRPKTDTTPISAKLRYAVLHRDNSRCRRCGRTADDGIKLVVDHILPRTWGGSTTKDNLWALCEECNLGKKHFESDVDAEAMKKVLNQSSGRNRILEYLKIRVGQVVTKEELIVVSGIHDHPRRVRELRDAGWDIVSFYEDKTLAPGDYILRSAKKRNARN